MDAKSVRKMYSIIAVTNIHIAKLHHVGSLYILTYDARKLKHKIGVCLKRNLRITESCLSWKNFTVPMIWCADDSYSKNLYQTEPFCEGKQFRH